MNLLNLSRLNQVMEQKQFLSVKYLFTLIRLPRKRSIFHILYMLQGALYCSTFAEILNSLITAIARKDRCMRLRLDLPT